LHVQKMRLWPVVLVLVVALWYRSLPRYDFIPLRVNENFIALYQYYRCEWKLGRQCVPEESAKVNYDILAFLEHTMESQFDFGKMGLTQELVQYQTRDGANLNIRITQPKKRNGDLPVFMYIHGGGWVAGSEKFVSVYGATGSHVLFSVEYRLAPEYKFPSAVNDCEDALMWVFKNAAKYGGDNKRITVGGTSAGGNLAAALSLIFRDKQPEGPNTLPKIEKLFLDVPLVSFLLEDESSVMRTDTPMWNTKQTLMARYNYFKSWKDWLDPRASPLLAESHKNLPKTLIVVCDLDPFYDGGKNYHEKLLAAGVNSRLVELHDTPHAGQVVAGFFTKELETYETELKAFLSS